MWIFLTVITIIAFLIGFIYESFHNHGVSIESLLAGTALGLTGTLIGIVIFAVMIVYTAVFAPVEDYVEEKGLYAINDTINYVALNPRFDSEGNGGLTYSYITDDEKGKHFTSITSNDVYVVETTDTPTLKVHKQKYKDAWYMRIVEPAINNDWVDYYEFYVPEGTVTYNYNLDLQ